MRTFFNIVSGLILSTAVAFGVLAVGNGKTGELYGTEFFITAASDMKALFVLLIVSIPALIYLLVSLFLQGQATKQAREKVAEWERWRQTNSGRVIP